MACRAKISCAVLVLLATAVFAADDLEAVRGLIKDRVDQGKAVGLVVGIVDEHGPRVAGNGHDGDTVFEIGSVTKLFTSLLLADMIERAEVKPDDPVSKYLPSSV